MNVLLYAKKSSGLHVTGFAILTRRCGVSRTFLSVAFIFPRNNNRDRVHSVRNNISESSSASM